MFFYIPLALKITKSTIITVTTSLLNYSLFIIIKL